MASADSPAGGPMDLDDNLFMLAGPVKMHPRVIRAMSVPAVAHRAPEFSAVNAEIRELLKYVFQTEADVAVISGSGTAGLEAAIASVFRKDERVLCLVNGKFGERLGELADLYATATVLESPWGSPVDLEQVEAALESGDYAGVALCHNETSTGLTNQAEAIGRLARKHDALYILDGITSVGGIEVLPEEWGADVVILGSQKCVAAPAGLAALSASERALDRMHSGSAYYLDLKKHVLRLRDGDQTPYTPAIPLFLAFREALRLVKEEGLENRIARGARLGDACRAAADAVGLELYPERDYASNTVTAIRYPDGTDDGAFRGALRERHGVVVAGAQAQIKGKVFRIGHMGICSMNDMLGTWGAIEAVLRKLGHAFEAGAAVAAVAERMR